MFSPFLSVIFFFAVFAPVHFIFRIGQDEDMIQLLFDGSDTAWILAFDHIFDLFRKRQRLFVDDFFIFNDIDRNVVIDESEDIQVDDVDRTFDFDDVLLAVFSAPCVLNHRNGTIQILQFQKLIDQQGFACLDMIQNNSIIYGD